MFLVMSDIVSFSRALADSTRWRIVYHERAVLGAMIEQDDEQWNKGNQLIIITNDGRRRKQDKKRLFILNIQSDFHVSFVFTLCLSRCLSRLSRDTGSTSLV